MNSVEGPLTSWIKATPPKPQVGNPTMLITNERNVHASLDIHVKEKRGRTELNIYEKREICRSTLSVKRIREKYGISRSGVYEIRSHGMSYFQKLIDRSMGSNHRNRAFNVRGGDYNDPEAVCYNKSEAMERVHRSCVQASSLWCPLTRNIVIDMIRQNTGLTSISALEDTYAKFRRYYGWVKRNPSARSDFLNSIMIHMRPLIGFSAEMKIKYAAVPQQQPMTNECGLHLVNNLCNLLFLVPVENKLTRKNISKTWPPCVPGALSHRPALTEELHDEEIIDTQDCLGQLILHPDNDRGDMDTEGWDQSVAYDDTFEL